MEKLLINTPQNVRIEYPLASVGTRILAFALDYAVIIAYVYFVYKFSDIFLNNNTDVWLSYGVLTLLFLPAFFYHFLLETFLQGQTLGKMAVKTKVVKIDGTRATVYEYFMRWTMSIVDIWMLSGLIGLLSVILSKKSQRIGDLAAGTTVINLKPKLKLIETVFEDLEDSYQITYPQVMRLSDKDMNIIKRSFRQAVAKNDYMVIDALTQKLKTILELNEIPGSQQQFIQTVIQDHYHYFREK